MFTSQRFNPQKPFIVVSSIYILDVNPDVARLRRMPRQGGEEVFVAAFGPSYDPMEVLRAAVDYELKLQSEQQQQITDQMRAERERR